MKPIPVVVHIGPLQLHTYGLGLAITFYFAYRYLERRLRANGYPASWVASTTVWVVVAAIVGARVQHVIANASFYIAQPLQVLEVWHGGLSSFGGLALGLPVGFYLAHKHLPGVRLRRLADLVAPVLLAAWALGRLLGPQLMVAGGGHRTDQWFGMYYAGQVGKRLPVPLFQSAMTFVVLLIAWQVERYVVRHGGPHGLVMAVSVGFWGLNRFLEEHLWLAYPGHLGAVLVQIAGAVLCVLGFAVAAGLLLTRRTAVPEPPAEEREHTAGEPVFDVAGHSTLASERGGSAPGPSTLGASEAPSS
jgi:phosphatidylglycerol:prolipoprotein diacylglycerol transferase